jgi:hypothetical protein
MCTASWLTRPGGYELFFNRDERRSRARGLPPRESALRGVRYLGPIDLACGGSWIAANELGVTLCLLNRYPDPHPPGAPTSSRGLIVLGLADVAGVEDAGRRLADANLLAYRPFTLLVAQPGREVAAYTFDGRTCERLALGAESLATSSSRDDLAAGESRRALWRALSGEQHGKALHESFHASHWPSASALSVCMHREDAETESFCRVRVDAESVDLAFVAGPPCGGGDPVRAALRRRATVAA